MLDSIKLARSTLWHISINDIIKLKKCLMDKMIEWSEIHLVSYLLLLGKVQIEHNNYVKGTKKAAH